MKNRKMFRYVVPVDDQPHSFPLSYGPVHVAYQPGVGVEFWAESAEKVPLKTHWFQVFGTGHLLPYDAQHIGTCPRTAEGLVWHLYEVTP